MLAKSDVDAVTIASPIGLHFEHARAALRAGKHIHLNKTMATTVAAADELIAMAATGGLRLVASPGEVLRPHVTRTRELRRGPVPPRGGAPRVRPDACMQRHGRVTLADGRASEQR
jgi:predicted dehydrogenase